MKRFIILTSVLALFSVLAIGCAGSSGMVGGKGAVPPPPPPRPDNMAPEKSQWPEDMQGPDEAMQAELEALAAYKADTMEKFRGAYGSAGQPRIMVFFNRQLSAEVREWATDERQVVQESGGMMKKTTGPSTGNGEASFGSDGGLADGSVGEAASGGDNGVGESSEKLAYKKEAQAYKQRHTGVGGGRAGAPEAWMWSFEDGFYNPFLEGGAKLIDRSTTMRLVAADSGRQGSATKLMSVKKVEMDALRGHADMFVEILVTQAPSSPYGYEFKATAKEVGTGLIKANVSSLRWNLKKMKKKEAVATASGYKVVEKEAEMPPVHLVSERLAVDLMNALANNWGGGS